MKFPIVQLALATSLATLFFVRSAPAKQILLRYPTPSASLSVIAADSTGNFFIAGTAADDAGRSLIRVTKLDPSGNPIGSLDLDASGGVAAAAADAQGNLILVGGADAARFPLVSPLFTGVTGTSAFVVKLDSQLHGILFSTLVLNQSSGAAVTLDTAGNIYVTGNSPQPFPVTAGAYHTAAPGVFILGISASGSKVLMSTQFGGSQVSCNGGSACIGVRAGISATAIAVDAAGGVVFAGNTTASDLPITTGVVGPACRCSNLFGAGFVAKLSAGGQLLWSTYISVVNIPGVNVYTVGLDAGGNVLVGGSTSAIQVTPGAVQSSGPVGGFISKLSSDATQFVWSVYLGGQLPGLASNAVNSLAVSPTGQVAFTGHSDSAVLRQFPGVVNLGNTYAAWLSADGTALQAVYLGSNNAAGAEVVITPSGNLATTGIAGSMWLETPGTGPSLLATGNAASGPVSPFVNPFELISLYGVGIGPQTATLGQVSDGAFTSSLDGYAVRFDGIPAPLLYAGPNQFNTIVPGAVAGQEFTNLRIVTPAGTVDGPMLAPVRAQPYVFQNATTNLSAALNQDGTLNTPQNPAKYGSIVTVFATGGKPSFFLTDGMLAPLSPQASLQLPVAVIGSSSSTSLEVEYAGDAPGLVAGVTQINFRVPLSPSPLKTYNFYLNIGGISGGSAGVAVSQ